MTTRDITLKGGPHDGRTLSLAESFAIVNTVEVVHNPPPQPPRRRWWQRRTKYSPPPEPYTFVQHQYRADTGEYISATKEPA